MNSDKVKEFRGFLREDPSRGFYIDSCASDKEHNNRTEISKEECRIYLRDLIPRVTSVPYNILDVENSNIVEVNIRVIPIIEDQYD